MKIELTEAEAKLILFPLRFGLGISIGGPAEGAYSDFEDDKDNPDYKRYWKTKAIYDRMVEQLSKI